MPLPEATLTDLRPGETEPLVRLWRRAFEHGVGLVDPHPIDEQIDYFVREVQATSRVHVARLGSRIVGFIACRPDGVLQLHVDVDHHRRGIGSVLLERAKQESGGSLWLYTFARNPVARRFYEHHGFAATAFGFEPTWQLDDVRYEWVRAASEPTRDPAPRGERR